MDQTTLTALFSFLPQPYSIYAADILGIAGMLSIVSGQIARRVKPPSTNHPAWLATVYRIATWPAQNLDWAASAVVPGMTPAVQQAALAAAKLAAAMPELALPPVAVPVSATVVADKSV